MPHLINLPVIRRALSNLDRIAAEHPEYCQHQGQWDEKAVEKILMATPVNERVSAYRNRLQAGGRWRLSAFITPDARESLNRLRKEYPDLAINDLVSGILTGKISIPPPNQPKK